MIESKCTHEGGGRVICSTRINWWYCTLTEHEIQISDPASPLLYLVNGNCSNEEAQQHQHEIYEHFHPQFLRIELHSDGLQPQTRPEIPGPKSLDGWPSGTTAPPQTHSIESFRTYYQEVWISMTLYLRIYLSFVPKHYSIRIFIEKLITKETYASWLLPFRNLRMNSIIELLHNCHLIDNSNTM